MSWETIINSHCSQRKASAWRNRDSVVPGRRRGIFLSSRVLSWHLCRERSQLKKGRGRALWAGGAQRTGPYRSSINKCPLGTDNTKWTPWHFRHRVGGMQRQSCLAVGATSVRQIGCPNIFCQLTYKIWRLEM